MNDSLIYQIAVSQIPGIGNINAKKLISKVGSAEGIFKEKKQNLLKINGIGNALVKNIINNRSLEKAEKEIEFIKKYNIDVRYYLDENYPNRLKHCEDSPIILFIKGKVDFENPKIISIVGTRSATHYGKEICEKLVNALSERGHSAIIISGLAYGIDTTAHKAALKYGLDTIAVLAHGLNTIYPVQHKTYAKKIIKQGALVTDFTSDIGPERGNFVKRNRIIAGLSDATIVIESGERGGALITADIANSYNRDVFAIPGNIPNFYSKGCNKLIKTNKAALLENIDDLEYILGWEIKSKKNNIQKKIFVELSTDEKKIYELLKNETQLPIDQICCQAEMPVSKVSPILLNLEFNGLVKSLPGNIYRYL